MSKVDWSNKADSTHVDAGTHCFYKKVDGKWMLHVRGERFTSSSSIYNGETDERNLIERPQPKPWSGPEDGLPPIGLSVMVHECSHDYTKKFNGQTVRIVGHDRGDLAVFAAKDFVYHALIAEKFKLPPTAEQLAAEEREKSVASMKGVFDSVSDDLMPTSNKYLETLFGALYDAGFKREACKSDCSTNNRGTPELLGPCDCR
jgi:hypothetical protein